MKTKMIMRGILFIYATNLISEPICISLGGACGLAASLRDLGVRKEAFPFDWTVTSHEALCKALADDFQLFLTDLAIRPNGTGVIDHYGIHFTHDWPTINQPIIDALHADFISGESLYHAWQEALPAVREKYARRIERFRNACRGKEKVIFIRADYEGVLAEFQKRAIEIRDYFESRYPTLDFMLIFIANQPSFETPWNIPRIMNFYDANWHNPNGIAHMLKQADAAFNNLRQVSHARTKRSELEFDTGYWLEDEMELD